MTRLIQTQLDVDGVLLATIDMPGRTMNVFSAALMDALEDLMSQVDADANIRSVVLTSGKSSFLAGADLAMVRGYCEAAAFSSHEAMFALCGNLGRQFVRLEACAKPWVAAINGIALGGGLELALACRVRIVADDPRIQLGVPEVKLGLLPGAGGTQRLPRLIGFESALELLLTGRSMAPAEALAAGLVAKIVSQKSLLQEAKAIARALHGQAVDLPNKFAHWAQTDVPEWQAATAKTLVLSQGISEDDFTHYPAYSAIADSVLQGARLPMKEASALEMTQFLRLMFNPVAGRMVRTLFLERLRGERELAAPAVSQLTAVRHGKFSDECSAWAAALGKLKVLQIADDSLTLDTLVLTDQLGENHIVCAKTMLFKLEPSDFSQQTATAVLAPTSPHGRVMELVAPTTASANVLAVLAALLKCLPWRTVGPAPLLLQWQACNLEVQAQIALQHIAQSARANFAGAGDAAFYDVAACLAGLAPGWSGGPLSLHFENATK